MKTNLLFLACIFFASSMSFSQTPVPPGPVSGTWTAGGTPYQIQGDINIPNGQTLTIEAGVIVEFQDR